MGSSPTTAEAFSPLMYHVLASITEMHLTTGGLTAGNCVSLIVYIATPANTYLPAAQARSFALAGGFKFKSSSPLYAFAVCSALITAAKTYLLGAHRTHASGASSPLHVFMTE